jgi:hypothetical protein
VKHALEKLPAKVISRIDFTDGCWIWKGGKTSEGYGALRINGKMVLAHRFVYQELVGPTTNQVLDHFRCDNRACVNPHHLSDTTHRENILRGKSNAALRAGATHCPKGHPYSPENTRWRKFRNAMCRSCITCNRAATKQWQKQQKEQKQHGIRHSQMV